MEYRIALLTAAVDAGNAKLTNDQANWSPYLAATKMRFSADERSALETEINEKSLEVLMTKEALQDEMKILKGLTEDLERRKKDRNGNGQEEGQGQARGKTETGKRATEGEREHVWEKQTERKVRLDDDPTFSPFFWYD